jgi:hypothetical protein
MTLSDDSLTRTCLNVYYSSGRDSSSSCDVIYKVSGSWSFDSVSLYNILDLKSSKDYSNKTGIGFYNGSVDSVSRVYSISYLQNGIKLGDYEKFYPKVVSISNIKSEDSNFRFNHIIPKVKVEENLGINSIGLDFSFTGVNAESLSKQFNSEDGKYYLYVNLYNSDKKLIKENIKVLIDLDNGTSVTIKDLDVDSVYYYKVYADMLEDGKIQVFDGVYENDYVNTFYKTSTADASTLLSKVVFKASAKDYVTSDDKNTISSKEISYNVNVTNGYMMKVRLELYDNTGSQVNFDGSVCNDNNCYKEIIGDSISDLPITDIYNTSDFVFGDGYYTLKVYAIPYYSDSGYDENSKLTLFDQPLSTTSTDTLDIDVHKLDVPTFNADLKSGVSDDDYYVTLSVIGVTDNDKVMKNGEYIINLYDENGNKIRVVKNSGDKVILTDGNGNVVNDNFIDGSLYVSNKIDVKFTGLDNNKRYTVELSYDTYRNNVNYTDSEKETASPYTNSIYTPISSGITLGEGYASKVSDTSFKLSYVGSHSINEIKKVSYKINLRGSSLVTSGEISGDTLFSCSDDEDVCSLLIDLNDSTFGNGFTLKEKGTYNVSIGFYVADGKNIANNFTYVIFV